MELEVHYYGSEVYIVVVYCSSIESDLETLLDVPISRLFEVTVQGDPSGCCLGCDDIKTKVAFQYRLLLLRNMQLLR